VQLRTPVFHQGSYTLDLKPILLHYLSHGLVFDLLGLLPLNLILGCLEQQEPSLIFICVLRLLRMGAVGRMMELYEKLQIHLKDYSLFMVVFKAFMFLMILWHWVSCSWYLINVFEYDSFEVTWVKQFNIYGKLLSQQYLQSMYYVIKIVTGVGQSDMIAYNNLERIIFIIFINIGDALFAIAFGLVAQI
jgi:hypothetical protein